MRFRGDARFPSVVNENPLSQRCQSGKIRVLSGT
jgi:hypothetical protein